MATRASLVVIVGGGFGGVAAAKGLKCSPVDPLLIDRSNHHVFQPLLYQVATSVLAPGQIASPIRSLLAEQANTSVMLGNVTGVNAASKQVIVDAEDKLGIRISYDYLILAAGATRSYFGHDEFAAFAPGLKSLSDAQSLRNHLLEVFEKAEIEDDPDRRQALMTFVMVGAGPTGVEMASAIAVMTQPHYEKTSVESIRSQLTSFLRIWGPVHLPPFRRSYLKPRGSGWCRLVSMSVLESRFRQSTEMAW
jgi:NADH dehydrogenase